jgi:hypothetical protein
MYHEKTNPEPEYEKPPKVKEILPIHREVRRSTVHSFLSMSHQKPSSYTNFKRKTFDDIPAKPLSDLSWEIELTAKQDRQKKLKVRKLNIFD